MLGRKIIGGLVGVLSLLAFCQVAGAQEYIPFRQRHSRLVVPKYADGKVIIKEEGPQLFFSDSPEMVKECGVTYRDTLSGKVRLFFHHVNATKSEKKLAVVLRNKSFRAATVTVGAQGISKPREEELWLLAGKEAQKDYYTSLGKKSTFKLLGSRELITGATGRRFKPNQLITGIIDLELSKPVEISVYMLPVHTDFQSAQDVYVPLAPDTGGHVLRGTFPTSKVKVTLGEEFSTQGDTIIGITLADNVKNPYVVGKDALTGEKVTNYGNYGVFYDVNFATTGKGSTLVKFSPEGGLYAGYGKFGYAGKTTLIPIPQNKIAFGERGFEDAITLGEIEGSQAGEISFSPPGSSNLPIKIILIPQKSLPKDKS